eukprot:scaffold3946_cov177-Amphora_coffeaeformis.AAC.21
MKKFPRWTGYAGVILFRPNLLELELLLYSRCEYRPRLLGSFIQRPALYLLQCGFRFRSKVFYP